MGRRKKETPDAHRRVIAMAAQQLFEEKGAVSATMDEVAQKAGYSKATLYVYFQNKDELIAYLTLESMKKLREYLQRALALHTRTKARYDAVCTALVQYRAAYPFYFDAVLGDIPIRIDVQDVPAAAKETYAVGEQLNAEIVRFLKEGMTAGELRQDIDPLPTAFTFWAALSGLVRLAAEKKTYLEEGLRLSQETFLRYGFDILYRALATETTD